VSTVLVVTGAGGMLGRATVAAAAAAGHQVVPLTRAELDLRDADAVVAVIGSTGADAVINCAAYTDVDGSETDEENALAVNGGAAGNLARAATTAGAHLVHVSTDYVFDGTKETPYVESDPVGPRSAYGRTKLAGERAVAAASADHAIVRTAWLFGEGGPNFVDTMLRLGAGREEISVVTDQRGCPTWTGHLAPVLVQIAERRQGAVQHAAGTGACTWNDLATEVFAQAGIPCRVLPTTSDAFQRPAPRPAFSVLGSERDDHIALPPWTEGVAAHLATAVPIGENA
jgi:dTDP-4-dehydrorhamnose reductase